MIKNFNLIYESIMASLISEATTEIQHGQVAEIRKQIKNLDKFYIELPEGGKAGSFDKIREVKDKTCKADAEFYNSRDKDQPHFYISLKDVSFRQFGGREDLFGQKIYKNMKDEATEALMENSLIKNRYDLIYKIFKKLDAIKIDKDGNEICDFKKLRNKIKGYRLPMFSFEIPENEMKYFGSCIFGSEMRTSKESTKNNVDMFICGKPLVTISGNTIKLSVLIEENRKRKGSVVWNPILHPSKKFDIIQEMHKMFMCFLFDENRHTFGKFKNCRFAVWPQYKVENWIHEKDILGYLK